MIDVLALYFESIKYAIDNGCYVTLENGKSEYTSKTLGTLCDSINNEDKLVLRVYQSSEEQEEEEDCES